MATDLDNLEQETAPLIERALTALMNEMLASYEASDFVQMPPQAREGIEAMLTDVYGVSMRDAGQPVIDDLKDCFPQLETKQDEGDLFQRLIEQYIEQYGAQKVQKILETTRKQIMGVIREGQREGLGVEEIAKMMRAAIPEFSRIRSRVIARTETHGSSQFAQYRTAQQSVYPLVKQWNSVEGTRTRTFLEGDRYDHRVMNGERVALEQPFMVPTIFGTKEPLMFCGDPQGSAGNIINCRCSMTFRRADRGETSPAAQEAVAGRVTQSPMANTKLLIQGIMQEQPIFAKSYDNSFDAAPALALRAISRSPDLSGMITGKKGAYATFDGKISMGSHKMGTRAYKNVYRHEYGHILDDRMAKANPNRSEKQNLFQSWDAVDDLASDTKDLEALRSGAFSGDGRPSARLLSSIEKSVSDRNRMRDDLTRQVIDDDLIGDPRAILRHNIPDAEPDDIIKLFDVDDIDARTAVEISVAWKRRDVYSLLQDIPRALGTKVSHQSPLAGLQDTFEAGTGGNIRIQFGHGKNYYSKTMRYMRSKDMVKSVGTRRYNGFATAQAFANWFEAYGSGNPAASRLYQNLWPKTHSKFDSLLKEYVGVASL